MAVVRCGSLLPVALLAFGALAACGSVAPDSAAQPVPVELPAPLPGVVQIAPSSRPYLTVQAIEAQAEHAVVRAPARLAFNDGAISLVGAPIEGRVDRVHVAVGERVEAGAPLVTLTSPAAAAARAELAGAEVALRAAETALRRQVQMIEQGVGIESERYEAEVRQAEAQKELARARTAAAFLGKGGGATVVVRAPIAGTVLARRATSGASVEPSGEPLVELGNAASLRVVAEVFERDLPMVRPGAGVEVKIASVPAPVRGTVTSVGAAIREGVRTAPVYIAIDEAWHDLSAGMYARVLIQGQALHGLSIPAPAVLIKDGARRIVYVERDELTFVARDVEVGPSIEGRVHVFVGLEPGERIVVEGALLLDGSADQLL
jgi:membrane fusion protein, heavy metal efflux system